MNDPSDSQLVEESLAGSGEAFSALVTRYQNLAYGVAIALVSDFDLARDVVQESFIRAYRDLGKLRDASRFAGWFRGIVRHTSFRALREIAAVRDMAEQLASETEGAIELATPSESVEQAERRELVRRALGRLSEKNREVVGLYYVDGFSYEEISRFIGVTETAVQGRLQRARAKLREEIEMVEKTFGEEPLPPDFSEEIARLLEASASSGREREHAIRRLAEIGEQAVDPLCEALGDPRIPVRRVAASVLCTIGDAKALGPMLRVLYAGDWALHHLFRTGRVLSIPGVREELIRFVRTGATVERAQAMEVLAHATGDDEVYLCVLDVFRDAAVGAVVRRYALDALCRLAPSATVAVDLVTEALNDPVLGRRHWWAWWIAWRNEVTPPVDVSLGGFSRRTPPRGRVFAGWLALRQGAEGRNALERVMNEGTDDERATAAVALAGECEDAFPILMRELECGYRHEKWVRIVAHAVVRNYPARIEEWTESREVNVAKYPGLAWAVAKSRIARGYATDDELLHYGIPSVRAALVRKIARERAEGFVPRLREFLREGKPRKVAQEAFWQMYRLKDGARPVVQDMLNSEHWPERKAAVCLLRRWGELTPELKRQAEDDPHIAVQHAAA